MSKLFFMILFSKFGQGDVYLIGHILYKLVVMRFFHLEESEISMKHVF